VVVLRAVPCLFRLRRCGCGRSRLLSRSGVCGRHGAERKLSLTLLSVVMVAAPLGVDILVGGTITSYHVLAA
jgi:hypothetical protein